MSGSTGQSVFDNPRANLGFAKAVAELVAETVAELVAEAYFRDFWRRIRSSIGHLYIF